MIREEIDRNSTRLLYEFIKNLKVLGMKSIWGWVHKNGYIIDTDLQYQQVRLFINGETLRIYNRYGQYSEFSMDTLSGDFYNNAFEFIREEVYSSHNMVDVQVQPISKLKRFFGVK